MSVWGKIGGAAAGLFVGGPVGALVGAVAGHLLLDRETDPGVTFTIAVIALSGKMAKADGSVSDAELEAFARVFRVPPQDEARVRRIFNLARQDVAGYEIYAGQIARLFKDGFKTAAEIPLFVVRGYDEAESHGDRVSNEGYRMLNLHNLTLARVVRAEIKGARLACPFCAPAELR